MSRCPICKRALPQDAFEPPFPFCSRRCKLADLHGWLNQRYVVSEPLFDLDGDGKPAPSAGDE